MVTIESMINSQNTQVGKSSSLQHFNCLLRLREGCPGRNVLGNSLRSKSLKAVNKHWRLNLYLDWGVFAADSFRDLGHDFVVFEHLSGGKLKMRKRKRMWEKTGMRKGI